MELGLRVVRGPDWKWGQQDGGVGHVGTVVEIGHYNSSCIPRKTVVVQWDSGSRSNYRVGYQGAYDLRVFDNAPAGAHHPRIACDECGSEGISGMRWQCSTCIDFDLCTPCYMKGAHHLTHPFIRIDTIYHLGLEMPKRSLNNTIKIQARGIFKGSRVVRGYDWEWDSQDGGEGKIGEVIDIRGWDKASGRSVASVRWQRSSNVYRLGHKGKVDLKCVVDAPGGLYYRDHLPILGQNFVVSGPPESLIGAAATARPQLATSSSSTTPPTTSSTTPPTTSSSTPPTTSTTSPTTSSQAILPLPPPPPPPQSQSSSSSSSSSNPPASGAMARVGPFVVGDKVKVIAGSVDELKSLQKGHGGWNPRMVQYINKIGIVHRITDNRDIRVQFDNARSLRWTFNPEALEKHYTYTIGDLVKVIDDEEQLKQLQRYHGEYVPDMRHILGLAGRVIKVYTDGDLRVNFDGKTWTLNPWCLTNLSELERSKNSKEKKPDFHGWKDWMDELGVLDESSREIYSTSVNNPSSVSTTDKKSIEGNSSSSSSSSSNINNNNTNNNNNINHPSSSKSLPSNENSTSNLLNGTIDSNNSDPKCLICDENMADIRFYPCGHQVCCSDCSDCIVRMKKCISCKQVIQKLMYLDSSDGVVYGIFEHNGPSNGASSSSSNIPFGPSSSSSSTSLLNNNLAKCIKTEGDSNISQLIQRNQYLESKVMKIEEVANCGICLENTKNVIFLCGHGACSECASTLQICHMCRKTITRRINVY